MPITRLDHVTAFYRDVVGLTPGPRPDFSFAGAWMYAGAIPVVHIVERNANAVGVIDHFAFSASDLAGYLANLRAHGIAYDITQLPAGVAQSGMSQVFFRDPDGARIEVDFAAGERRDQPSSVEVAGTS